MEKNPPQPSGIPRSPLIYLSPLVTTLCQTTLKPCSLPHLRLHPSLPFYLNLHKTLSPKLPPNPTLGKNPNPLISKPGKKFYLRFIPPSSRGPDQVGVCSSDAVAPELQILDNTLVGFFLGKRPGFTYVRSALLKQWRLSGSVEVLQLLHGGIAFRFSCISDRDLIVDQGMFYVGGQPIFLRPWEHNMHTGSIMGLKKIPLWVTLPGLPLHLWGEESLSAVCSVLGKALFTDQITAARSRWAFVRACVEFSGEKPLRDSVMIEDDEGNLFHQLVKYSWKPPQCLSCGTFGHGLNACKSNPAENETPAINPSDLNAAHKDESLLERARDGSQPSSSSANKEAMLLERTSDGCPPSAAVALAKGIPAPSLLQGWKFQSRIGRLPMRVRMMSSSLTRDPSHLPGSADCQSYRQVSNSPSSPPVLSPKPKKPPVDQQLSQQNSNLSAPAQKLIPILVRVGSLDSSEIQSEPLIPSSSPGGPSSPLVSSLDGMAPLVHSDPTPTLARDNLSRYFSPGSSVPEPNPLIQHFPSGTSPYSPANRDMTGPFPSSAGHTPFPSSSTLNLSSFSSYQDSVNPPFSGSKTRSFPLPIRRPNQLTVRTINGNNLHALMAPICKKNLEERSDAPAEEGEEEDEEEEDGLEEVAEEEDSQYRTEEREENTAKRKQSQSDLTCSIPSYSLHSVASNGDEPDQMMEPIPYFNSADDMAEDIEEEVDEEDVGTEEDVDEDSEEEKENQLERVDAVEETDRRKNLSNYGRYDDLWVTTNLNDPRRINFW